ncbi:hypothetical protein OHA21_17705 [Actinoplanes sp. NBC_00393]|uniref:hypothetical protein n=1 Tax=Actinoplanes sp. NBC_00393 TaxID=2975953 RepID=UPI002E1A44E5
MTTSEYLSASPFAAGVFTAGAEPPVTVGTALVAPFAEAMTAEWEDLDRQAVDALAAELDDDEFEEAVRALGEEAAGRHLRGAATWSAESDAPAMAAEETRQWLESVAAEAGRMLGRLEEHFADRTLDSLREGELESVAGLDPAGPLAAQEQFFKSVLNKARKLASGVRNLAAKGLKAVAKIMPLGKLFGILRQLIKPLLRRVLDKAIGKLPAAVRPIATRLAARFTGEAESAPDLAAEFDRQLADAVLAPNDAALEHLLAEAADTGETGGDPLRDLDAARARLARELTDAEPNQPPAAQMEQFLPAVMAARPAIRLAMGVVGREKIVNILGNGIAQLIKGMVGPEAARLLSRHIASAGLGLLGLEAETGADPGLGAEALVATVEDTVHEVLALPPEQLGDELLVAAETQAAFAEAAARHLPAAVLRPEVVESESEGEHGFWVMMPRATRPCYRFKKYSQVLPVRISRPIARSVAMAGGDTLESRLLDAGVQSWPVTAELEVYELLDGANPGHLAAYEVGDLADIAAAAGEFEELSAATATALARNPRLAGSGRRRRFYRLRVGRRALRRHRLFALRLDLTAAQPVLGVHLRVGERDAHTLAGHLDKGEMVQVVALVRRLVGPAAQQRLAERLTKLLTRHGVRLDSGAAGLAGRLADGIVAGVSAQLPAAATTLTQAAKDPAAGVTLTYRFTFPDRDGIGTAAPPAPTLTVRPGLHHD